MLNYVAKSRWLWAAVLFGIAILIALTLHPNPYRTGNVSTFHLNSKHLHDNRRIWIYLPPGYEQSDKAYPVLILQDGQNVFDGSTSTHKGMEWRVDETLERMMTAGDIPPLIVVAIDSTETRHDEYLPERVIEAGVEEGGKAEQYAAMLIDELMPFLNSHYRLLGGPTHTYVGGSSYGGVLSFYLAMNHADTFGAALISSPATAWNDRWMQRTTEQLFWKTNVKLWLDFGFSENEPDAFFDTVNALRDKGWRVPYDLQFSIDGGTHIEAAWARRFPAMIDWLMNQAVFVEEANL